MTAVQFLADECCPVALVAELRAGGHDVRYIAEDAAGLSDEDVLQVAVNEDRILVTTDKDFGTLVVRLGYPVPGVVLVRVSGLGRATIAAEVAAMIKNRAKSLSGHVSTVTIDRIRRRSLPSI